MMHRIVVLAAVSVLATAVSAGAASAGPAPGSAGPRPPGPTTPPPGGGLSGEAWAWTQLTSHGTQIRYVSTDNSQTCPTVNYTLGTSRNPFRMRRLSTPMGSQFPTTVCELRVPLTASNAVLQRSTVQAAKVHPSNRQLPLPKWTGTTRPATIGVIGDTGCSLPTKPADPAQDCAKDWPFEQIATSLAKVTKPDLVIHTGDYLYREDPSRASDLAKNPGCQTPTDAASWDCVVADFFRPAETLLAAAPVALTRGNHEDCNPSLHDGAGGAWFRYLADELRSDRSCSLFTDPAFLRAGTLNLVNVDSSLADPDDNGGTANQGLFTAYFNAVNRDAAQPQHMNQDYFVFTHKPLWMVKSANPNPTVATHVLDAAVADTNLGRLRDNVRLALSGHIHLYQMLDFDTHRPPQLTVGSSGGPLDNGPNDSKVMGMAIGTPPQPVHQSITQEQSPPGGIGIFGYADLTRGGGTWSVAFHESNGKVKDKTCTLSTDPAHKSFTCH